VRVLSAIKSLVFPEGRVPRRILAGAFADLVMQLDLRNQSQLYVGAFEREIQPWLQTFATNAKAAVDVGVAEGEYCLYFLRKSNVRKVFGFEPMADCRRVVEANLLLNGLAEDERLQLSEKFVGAVSGRDAISLDSIIDQLTFPVVVKVDVDGAEMDVLRGAGRLISLPQVRWIIETHTLGLERDCLKCLATAGYKTHIVRKAWWRIILPELRTAAHHPENHNRWLIAARPEDISF
jgi:methyltransferase FkbM-like protein